MLQEIFDRYKTRDSSNIDLRKVVLRNKEMSVEIINAGASIYAINLPNGQKEIDNIVVNYPDFSDYLDDNYYIGCTVGRVAGRLKNGELPIGNKIYQLTKNENEKNHLHGGFHGFNKKIFDIISVIDEDGMSTVTLFAGSPDMEEGYPGNLNIWVTYCLTDDNNLEIRYDVLSNMFTHVNLTNHSYFNLTGCKENALNQQLMINADRILNTDDLFIPTGKTSVINNTAYDFTELRVIVDQKQYVNRKLFNECYILEQNEKPAAILFDPHSNRKMEVRTSYPSILFYSGDELGTPFKKSEGICLEAQFFPDTANQPFNQTTLIQPGIVSSQYIKLKFSW